MRVSELLSFPPSGPARLDEVPLPLTEGGGISRPKRGPNCTPDRPPSAVSGGGTVTVEYVVHTNGRVGEVALASSDAPRALFKTVRVWLQSCPYTPAMRDGRPVPVTLSETFTFKYR
jgi:TonB family protein